MTALGGDILPKKLYTYTALGQDPMMLQLTDDQAALMRWLQDEGWEFEITEYADAPIEIPTDYKRVRKE